MHAALRRSIYARPASSPSNPRVATSLNAAGPRPALGRPALRLTCRQLPLTRLWGLRRLSVPAGEMEVLKEELMRRDLSTWNTLWQDWVLCEEGLGTVVLDAVLEGDFVGGGLVEKVAAVQER